MNKIGSTKLSLSRKPRIEKIVAAKGKKKNQICEAKRQYITESFFENPKV